MSTADLRQQIGGLSPRMRPELRCTRTLFGGRPSYVVRDPITGRVHRLSCADYQVFCHLNGTDTLEDIFATLVARDLAEIADEERFYRFVMRLQDMGLITLPLNDGAARYQTFLRKLRSQTDQKLFNFLFLRIPLISPDAFLERTAHYMRPFFTRAAAIAWIVLMALGTVIACARFADLSAPLLSIVELQNLPWLLLCLVALKVIHEFGHAYACKILGGPVPEMGVVMVVLTPLAYVDATAAWSFPKMRDRIVVSLAGMYVESVCAVLALFVWAMTGPGLVNTIAYQSFVLASVVTVIFNLNPLMRFDGYYVLSDVLSIPNLRGRSQEVLRHWFDRSVLRLPRPRADFRVRTRVFLGWFGLSSSIYRVVLVLSICATIAMEFYFLGMGLAALYVGKSLLSFVWRSIKHLCYSNETAGAHGRGAVIAAIVFVAIPTLGALVPVALPFSEFGIVKMERESVVRARTPGFIERVSVQPGQTVDASQVVAVLENKSIADAHWEATAAETLAEIEFESMVYDSPEDARVVEVRQKLLARITKEKLRELQALRIRAPQRGRVLRCLPDHSGSFLGAGDEVLLVGDGKWTARVLLDEQGFANLSARVGDTVECSVLARPGQRLVGRIAKIGALGARFVEDLALTSMAGGNIVVDPKTQEAQTALFEITVHFDARDASLRHGMKLLTRFEGIDQPLIQHVYRRVLRFTHALRRTQS